MGYKTVIWACLLVVTCSSIAFANLEAEPTDNSGPTAESGSSGNGQFPGGQPQVVGPNQFPGSEPLFAQNSGFPQLFSGASEPYLGTSQPFPAAAAPYPGVPQYTVGQVYPGGLPQNPFSPVTYGSPPQATVLSICALNLVYPSAIHPICQNQNQFRGVPYPPLIPKSAPLMQFGNSPNSPFRTPSVNSASLENPTPFGNALPFNQNLPQLTPMSGIPTPAYTLPPQVIVNPQPFNQQLFPECPPEVLKLLGIQSPLSGVNRPSPLGFPVAPVLPQNLYSAQSHILYPPVTVAIPTPQNNIMVNSLPLPPVSIFSVNSLPQLQLTNQFSANSLPLVPKMNQFTANALPFQQMNQFTANALPSQQANQFTANALPFQQTNQFTANALPFQQMTPYTANAIQYRPVPVVILQPTPYNPYAFNTLANAFPHLHKLYPYATNSLSYPNTKQLYYTNPSIPVFNGTKSLL